MSGADDPISRLRAALRARGAEADGRWRAWAAQLMRQPLTPELLTQIWSEILDFDDQLARYIADPVATPQGTVLVAGSGKEDFKTFNVSTASAILAAAAGVPVLKGVSRSVSAVSGAADVLECLGIASITAPNAIPQALEDHGVAFVSYDAFCPRYATRYDGVFACLSPLSFFMPIAVLAARACGYAYGLAHREVDLAVLALHAIRPELERGVVVATELRRGEFIDEHAAYGQRHTARLHDTQVRLSHSDSPPPDPSWRTAVSHGASHCANAAALRASLAPEGDTPLTQMVELNAALIASAASGHQDAPRAVHEARISGRAEQLLTTLRTSERSVA